MDTPVFQVVKNNIKIKKIIIWVPGACLIDVSWDTVS